MELADYFIHQDEPENFADTVEGHYKAIFLKSFDLVLECMKDRFEQAGLDMYSNLQDLLLLAANGKDYSEQFKAVSTFYKGDFEENRLKSQLQTFSVMFERKEDLIFQDIIDYFKQLGPGAKTLLSEVGVIVKLVQLLPATTASPERSFSKMKLTKNYLRSTRTQPCLNHFMILSIYPEYVDKLDSKSILEEFIRRKGHGKLFGKSESSGPLKTPMPELP